MSAEEVRQQLREYLRSALGYLETGIPVSCGQCGTPNASCDCECMNASYYWKWREGVRELLKSNSTIVNVSMVRLSTNLLIALDYLDRGIPKYGKIGFGHYQSWLDRTNKLIAPEPVIEEELVQDEQCLTDD